MKIRDIIIAVFVIFLLGGLAYLWFSPAGLQPAPAVRFKVVDGGTLELQQLHGRPVLVTFWATSCPGCIKEMPHLIELYHDLQPEGLEIIGVAMGYDPPNHVLQMRKERNIPYPIALDIDNRLAQAFGDVKLTPTHFLIDPQGRIVQHKIGELDMAKLRSRIIAMLNETTQG